MGERMDHFCRYCHKPFGRPFNRDRHERHSCQILTDQESVGGVTMGDGLEKYLSHESSVQFQLNKKCIMNMPRDDEGICYVRVIVTARGLLFLAKERLCWPFSMRTTITTLSPRYWAFSGPTTFVDGASNPAVTEAITVARKVEGSIVAATNRTTVTITSRRACRKAESISPVVIAVVNFMALVNNVSSSTYQDYRECAMRTQQPLRLQLVAKMPRTSQAPLFEQGNGGTLHGVRGMYRVLRNGGFEPASMFRAHSLIS